MRFIPKNTKVRSTIFWKFTLPDIFVLGIYITLAFFFVMIDFPYHFLCLIPVLLIGFISFIPTTDGFAYLTLFQGIAYLFSKKKYSRQAKKDKETVKHLVPITGIDEDGIILYNKEKAGFAYGAVLSILQKNFAVLDDDTQDEEIALLTHWLQSFESKNVIDIVKVDKPVNLDLFSHLLYEKISDLQFTEKNKTIASVKETILTERINEVCRLNKHDILYKSNYYVVLYGNDKKGLMDQIRYAQTQFETLGISGGVLNRRDVAIFLKLMQTNRFDDRQSIPNDDSALVDWILPETVSFNSKYMVADDVEQCTFALRDYPMAVRNCWGSKLMNIPETKVVFRMRPVTKQKAIARIDHAVDEMSQRILMSDKASEANNSNIHTESMLELLDTINRDGEALFDCSLFITGYNYKKDPKFRTELQKKIRSIDFRENNLWTRQKQAFVVSSLVPEKMRNTERGIQSSSVMAIYPFVHSTVMDSDGTLIGKNSKNSYPFFFDLWKWEKDNHLFQNANAFVVGKSGSGKSFFLKSLISNEWANGTRIAILDPEAEYINLTKNICGRVIDVGNTASSSINPFQIYAILSEDGRLAPPDVTFYSHLKTLESFLRIVMEGMKPDPFELLNALVVKTYAKLNIDERTNCSSFEPSDFPTFSDLYGVVQEELEQTTDTYQRANLYTIISYLEKFVNGRYSDIWNRYSNLATGVNVLDFNFQSLFAQKNNVVASAQMLLIFRFLEQEIINMQKQLKGQKNTHIVILIDEAHMFINPKYPIATEFMYSMSKRIRKYGGSIIPATQNISDWTGNEELFQQTMSIIKNSQYSFIFKLSDSDILDLVDLYSASGGLNEEECKRIKLAPTGETFYIGGESQRFSVTIQTPKLISDLFVSEVEQKRLNSNSK